jgi:hypothetical protein
LGKNLPVVPSRESNSGLPYSKPTRYQLSHAAILNWSKILIAYGNGFRLVFKIISIGGSQLRQLDIRYCTAGSYNLLPGRCAEISAFEEKIIQGEFFIRVKGVIK